MRIAIILLIGIHGTIPLVGFFKAFGISEFNVISQPISKIFGIVWLLTFFLFAVTIVLIIAQTRYWWVIGIAGVVLSRFLIINYWSDAKFGTISNLIILVFLLLAFSTSSFKKKISDETAKCLRVQVL